MMYTSGCPKNQKICWYITGSPPPAALKNDVPKWRSNSTIVTAPASTGMTAISRNAVMSQVHANIGNFISVMPGARMLSTVTMILIAPMIEEAFRKDRQIHAGTHLRRQWRVHSPSGGRRAAGYPERTEQQHAGRRQQPEAQVVHPCKRHIGSPDLQRNHPVYEAHERRHDRPEDHDQAVFRDELVKKLRPHDLQARLKQLSADHQCHYATN